MSNIGKSPGEFLSHWLEKRQISIPRFSKDICISPSAARLVVMGKTKISVPVALKLARYSDTNPEYWLKMQMDWDIAEAAQDKKLMDTVKKISKFQKDPDAGKKPAAKKAAAEKKPAPAKKAAGAKKKAADGEKPAGKRGRPAAKAK